MAGLGLIGFANPWLLGALAALPAIWWLLRTIPPAPRRLRFPPLRLLLGLGSREETPARTPPWLLILRLVLAALLILALAGPVLFPEPRAASAGPLVLAVDDGWAAAPDWPERRRALLRLAERAARDDREVVLVRTAPDPSRPAAERMTGADALARVADLDARPWPVDRAAAARALARLDLDRPEVVYLADGVAGDRAGIEAARAFGRGLAGLGGPVRVFTAPGDGPLLLAASASEGGELRATLRRPAPGPARTLTLRALGPGGEVLRRQPLAFADGAVETRARVDLPLDVRNRVARFEVEPAAGVGGVALFDETWRRRAVGLIDGGGSAQPLLSELYYVERALRPYAELRAGEPEQLIERPLSLLVLPDGAGLDPTERREVADWVAAGGVLVRFAGPRLAASPDDLVPTPLRPGDRRLGGALSWSEPLALGGFAADGPLAGLAVPDDVAVRRQVLAEAGPDAVLRGWATLEDGTPLVSGARRGKGWLVLVHTAANASWSDLPLSGVFVDVLRRFLDLGRGVEGGARGQLAPLALLDADGRLASPPAYARPLEATALTATPVGPRHPPGLYGRPIEGEAAARRALNLAPSVPDLGALAAADYPAAPEVFATSSERPLAPLLLTLAMILALIDAALALALRGLTPLPRLGRAASAAAVLALTALAGPAEAADDAAAAASANTTRLAYVVTGVADVDAVSRAGLDGLTRVLAQRTSVEGEPLAIDLDAAADLALIPLLYWPVPPEAPDITPEARERVAEYMRRGGLVLFDTKDAGFLLPGQGGEGPGGRRLRAILGDLALPPLMPTPEDHALTRSFYLLQEFPGRYAGQPVWLDAGEAGVNDGVASVIVGSNDWAAAWAVDDYGAALFPTTPGGERQREMARRFGVNLVVYALTGNYKTDQVHVPALLERLGQ